MRKNQLQVANFICTFGASGDLLDYANEIVIPTFFNDSLVREYGSTKYYIYEPFWWDFGENGESDLAICGRFVKETVLRREQIIVQGALTEDHQEMDSVPSAFFVLMLRDHRLIYFAETSHAPELQAFASTLRVLMRRVWRKFIAELKNSSVAKVTMKQLQLENPMPTLTIIPVAKEGDIRSLLADFKQIQRIKFRLIKPNQETDTSEVLQSVRDRFTPLSPERLDLEMSDSTGLDHGESASAVEEAAAGLNTDILVSGKDAEGNPVQVRNDEFALRVAVDDPPSDPNGLAERLFREFKSQVKSGLVRRGSPGQKAAAILQSIKSMVL